MCWKVHDRRHPHYTCTNTCNICTHKDCEGFNTEHIQWVHCKVCNRYFPSQTCYGNHKTIPSGGTKTSCSTKHRCKDCNRTLIKTKIEKAQHHCGKVYCNVCKDHAPVDHKCFVKQMRCDPEKNKEKWAKKKVMYYDFETCGSGEYHSPVMVALSDETGDFKKTFWGENCVVDLCDLILSKKFKNTIFFAHNAGRFDQYLILEHVFKTGFKPEVIYNAGSMLYLKIPSLKIEFKDTYMFIPRALAALPKMFGIAGMAKTFFPHLLPFSEYEHYTGCYVDTKYYDVDQMSCEKRKECIEWVEKQQNDKVVFNYKDDMTTYCENDVEVLRACGEKFRELFRIKGQTDPFVECMTLSQSASFVYRKLYMPKDSIAIIPPWGYKTARAYSNKGIVWIEYMSSILDSPALHARNGGEYKTQEGVYVDGFIKPPADARHKGTILEFTGCHTHGCPSCYNRSTVNPQCGETMEELYEKYITRKAILNTSKYKYIEIWEHEYDTMLKTNDKLKATEKRLDLQEPLVPRDCLYGGRVEPFELYREINEQLDELLRYLDINSLYPYVQRENDFPEGHPQILLAPDPCDFPQWFGLIKAKIAPPEKLWLPVLPLRSNGKLLFSLCYTCSVESAKTTCTHTHDQRVWVGSYTTVEVAAALARGYTLECVYEVWNWPPEQRSNGLFRDFINSFIKLKLMGAGFPKLDMTDDEKSEYARELSEREGIDIKAEEIEDNPGIRALGKQVVNSLWGKICQNTDKSKTVYISNPAEYFALLLDDKCDISDVHRVNDNLIEVVYKTPHELAEPHPFVNHAVASFVTSYARLHLYSFLEPLGKNVLYADTDSCVFATGPGLPDLKTGPCLGEMSCEIYATYKKHDSIGKFVTVGPKSYGYQLRDNPHIKAIKCKGITLNFNTVKQINLEYMIDLVTHDECRFNRETVQYTSRIRRNRKKMKIESKDIKKSFGFTFDKRLVNPSTYTTLPLGYVGGWD